METVAVMHDSADGMLAFRPNHDQMVRELVANDLPIQAVLEAINDNAERGRCVYSTHYVLETYGIRRALETLGRFVDEEEKRHG